MIAEVEKNKEKAYAYTNTQAKHVLGACTRTLDFPAPPLSQASETAPRNFQRVCSQARSPLELSLLD